jgi:hypothetical protein
MVRADTLHLLHKNAPHTSGDRYVVVLYNKDLNYSKSSIHLRSAGIKQQPRCETAYTCVFDSDEVRRAREKLLKILAHTKLPRDRCTAVLKNSVVRPHSKYGANTAQFVSFGITASRKCRLARAALGMYTRESQNANNTRYPQLYSAFCEYMNVFAPGKFGQDGVYHACIISKNSQCEWHTDRRNIGHASLSALGTFEGGELLIQDSG